MSEVLSPAQRRTLPAREALAAKFPTPEAKREFYRSLGVKSSEGRVVLPAEDAAALAKAYALLSRIADKLPPRADDAVSEGGER